jgi:regulatory protein
VLKRRASTGVVDEAGQPAIPDPSVVTRLAPHPRREGRFAVELNDVSAGHLSIDLVSDLAVRAGSTVEGPALANLLDAMRRTALLDKALDLLAVSDRSTRDLSARLRRHAGDAGDIPWVVDRLTAQGYLDDVTYARRVAESRARSRAVSRRAIRDELQRKGIAPDLARSVLAEVADDVELDDYATAVAAARRRLRALRSYDHPTRRRRLAAWLARRGFEGEVICSSLL